MRGNRLAEEASLYLRQHAHNPVHWWPWGEEALAHARAVDKPILVSIGYSACHWCHVMERESFEDPEVAAFQNAHFVSIKVDREERPDVDRVYMAACQVVNRSGGWPLNAFALGDGRPFYAGTYFPPTPKQGRPSWRELLEHLADAWANRREELIEGARELTDIIARHEAPDAPRPAPDDRALHATHDALLRRIDPHRGGFGGAPKFPSVTTVELGALLSRHLDRHELHDHEGLTLDQMADGGIYDHVGGGFARYSTDAMWLVPHFEKMLYDNGLLLRLYADAGLRRVMFPERWAEAIAGTAAWLRREMTDDDGALAAAVDADAAGEEGTFYVWTPATFDAAVGADAASLRRFFGVSQRGNVEETGATVLARTEPVDALARRLRVTKAEAKARLADATERLRATRSLRPAPARDDKRITAWNAYAIQGLARASLALRDGALLAQAESAASATLARAWDGARLLRLVEPRPGGGMQTVPAFLDDASALALALLDLHLASGEARWLEAAGAVTDWMTAAFFDPEAGTFALTSARDPLLAVTPRNPYDDAVPSPIAAAALALQRLGALSGRSDWGALSERVIATHGGDLERSPLAAATLLRAQIHARVGLTTLVAVHAGLEGPQVQALREEAARAVEHDDLWVVCREGDAPAPGVDPLWVHARPVTSGARTTWYACRGTVCGLPAASAIDAVRSLPARG